MNESQQNAINFNREVISGSKEINNFLSTSGQVAPVFHTHFIDMESGKNGIANLIAKILTENDAVFPRDIENTELRSIVIASAMLTSEIMEQVEEQFKCDSKRYPRSTIENYLSVFMFRTTGKHLSSVKVGKIQLTKTEDANRKCAKPRCKWYLIAE